MVPTLGIIDVKSIWSTRTVTRLYGVGRSSFCFGLSMCLNDSQTETLVKYQSSSSDMNVGRRLWQPCFLVYQQICPCLPSAVQVLHSHEVLNTSLSYQDQNLKESGHDQNYPVTSTLLSFWKRKKRVEDRIVLLLTYIHFPQREFCLAGGEHL